MDKIAIGLKIKEERKKRGFSQLQLGTLCGLTDKAVSKWENGKAIPDRTVCEKLSGLLGFDLDIMINEDLPPDEAEKLVNKQINKLWEKAEERMKELYGEDPPLQVENRFIMERDMLHSSRCIILFDILAKVKEAAIRKPARFDANGSDCFLSFLLGATAVNPMEPHLRCPKCKKVEFHPEVQSGWDLEEKVCECGARMEADGQDIPVESYILGGTGKYEYFKCAVDTDFFDEAEKIILNYGEQFFAMERYHEEEEEGWLKDPILGQQVYNPETGEKERYHYMPLSVLLFAPKKKAKIQKPERISGPSEMINWGRESPYPAICLMGGFIEPSYLANPSPFRSTPDKLVRQDIMERALKDYWEFWGFVLEERTDLKFPDLTPYIGKLTFGKFVTLICSVNNLYMCSGPEELAKKVGFDDLTELPLSREDLWKMICSRTPYPGYMTGTVGEIMWNTAGGKYLKNDYSAGPTERDRKLFREMNLPEWFEDYAAEFMILCYRRPYIDLAIRLLEDARQKIRERR